MGAVFGDGVLDARHEVLELTRLQRADDAETAGQCVDDVRLVLGPDNVGNEPTFVAGGHHAEPRAIAAVRCSSQRSLSDLRQATRRGLTRIRRGNSPRRSMRQIVVSEIGTSRLRSLRRISSSGGRLLVATTP